MTLALNIVLIAIVFSAIVGMLARAIQTSRPARPARTVRQPRPATSHATRTRGARSRAYGSFERTEA